ncbi:hypothetical protein V2J94_41540 [Streptomyces sp. DSM 41524]|uniref:Uncharacterized protein n=1 Tax=Streptomyces asiaticus subsp. ignotus TaxID=3098222 RepID=A0ABU7QAF8_9ACTN|nr:hypothetical protein [Streptomyces sp. DSM 41524]
MATLPTLAAAAVLLAAGYTLGRWRPARRASDWANWKKYHLSARRNGPVWWAVWLVLSAENIAWLIAHPIQGAHNWRHRNDPPPPLDPAPKVRDFTKQETDRAS